MNRRILSSVFLLLALVVLSLPYINFTGSVIKESEISQGTISFLALIFFGISVFLFLSRKSLDAIIIPLGDPIQKKRVRKAIEEYDEEIENDPKGKHAYFVISGERGNVALKDSERYMTYNELRKHGISPSNIVIEGKSYKTMENILNSLEKIKERGGREVGIASYPWHLERINYIIKKAKEEGIVDKDFKIHNLETSQTVREGVYGIIADLVERYRLRSGFGNYRENKDQYIEKIWRRIKLFINPEG